MVQINRIVLQIINDNTNNQKLSMSLQIITKHLLMGFINFPITISFGYQCAAFFLPAILVLPAYENL